MANLTKKQLTQRIIMLAIITAVLVISAVVVFVCTYVYGKDRQAFPGMSFPTFEIENSSEFVVAIKHNAQASGYERENYVYNIKNNIDIYIDDLPEGVGFYGRINGQGHTVTIKPKGENDTIERPIFNILQSSAVIERLNIVAENIVLSAEEQDSIALLATVNRGTIKNCNFEIFEMEIGRCPNVAAIVNYNYGCIANVCVSVQNVKSEINNGSSWKSSFGTVSTVNYSQIKNVLIDVNFDDDLFVFLGQYLNTQVGYMTSESSQDGTAENIYLFGNAEGDFRHLTKACDVYKAENGQLNFKAPLYYYDIDDELQAEIENSFNLIGNRIRDERLEDGNNFLQYWTWNNTTKEFPRLR